MKILRKLFWMVVLIAALLVASSSTVDFVYRAF